ncbi:hypothetical protein PGIGA_G00213220 [Pangasianodon gigas]|uniref:Uncharacterized protein n=1 Tax=Pangasianodon gigas TaxID=30993 RepID=A0ACC5WH65_PANGG|nr:hypothetical protein [Pangasianodon gigas]
MSPGGLYKVLEVFTGPPGSENPRSDPRPERVRVQNFDECLGHGSDNAYDPDVSATQFWIDKTVIKDLDCLIFMDNGNGMDYDEMHKMLSFGFSDKQTIRGHVPVGLYGNGFKSCSMRLGKDAIVFSKKANTMCVGLLSQTYLEKIKAQNVIVPIVMFTKTRQTNILYLETER